MSKKRQQSSLQALYDAACWYGTARDQAGRVWCKDELLSEALRLGVKLDYPHCC